MVQKILTAEELDGMISTEPKTESGHAESIKRVADSLRELKNHRSRVGTLEDALDAYDGQVADAYKTRELGYDMQVSALKNIGRAGTGNFAWSLPPRHSDALALIADHEGPQTLRNRVLAAEFGMSLENEYKPLVKAHNGTTAVLRKEVAEMRLASQQEQAQRIYESDLDSIEGDD